MDVEELGGMKVYKESSNSVLFFLFLALIGSLIAIGGMVFLAMENTVLKEEVAALQEQSEICVYKDGILQYAPDGNEMCDSLRNFVMGMYQEHQFALVDHRNAIVDLNRNVAGHEQVLIKIVGDLYQQPEGVSK